MESESMTNISRLTDKKFWEQSGNDIPVTSANTWFQKYFDSYILQGHGRKALEIGVCPGNNLAAISKSHNYTPYGIDILDSVTHLPDMFRKMSINNMQAINGDVFK